MTSSGKELSWHRVGEEGLLMRGGQVNLFSGNPICPYCGRKARLGSRSEVGEGSFGNEAVWICPDYPDCDSYVGCHAGTSTPLGTMANGSLRHWRKKAHRALDWAWKSGLMTRSEAYHSIQKILDLPEERAHIGMMSEEQCWMVEQHFNSLRPWKMPLGRRP